MKKIILSVLFVILIILIAIFILLRSGVLSQKITLYFFKTQNNHQAVLTKTQRKGSYLLNPEEKLKYAIDKLLKGPDKKETKSDIFSFIPSKTIIHDVKIKNDIAYLNFDKQIESGGGTENMEGRLSQIVFTATQFPQVKKVRFLINGKKITSFSGEGLTDVDKPLGRNNMKKILP
ncbi:MAG: GerMN domain-containing protein [Candidatus Omnitrophica bacterium]|nr:GerMN domain-containing protein [Candidatus Omnitrophota bacterium]